ncbi:unnamed protein product [Schistosoma margrebowiei]|uniref:Uncharacterized protein n=1 Tax=Schistosoma margrebowiei TaxID=48269 RepID=A0A183LPA9_9TREM|nr:unnamed protein product [Schistosoma margrebowiei]
MVVGSSRHETLDPGFVLLSTRQQGVPVIVGEITTIYTKPFLRLIFSLCSLFKRMIFTGVKYLELHKYFCIQLVLVLQFPFKSHVGLCSEMSL